MRTRTMKYVVWSQKTPDNKPTGKLYVGVTPAHGFHSDILSPTNEPADVEGEWLTWDPRSAGRFSFDYDEMPMKVIGNVKTFGKSYGYGIYPHSDDAGILEKILKTVDWCGFILNGEVGESA